MRPALEKLVECVSSNQGDREALASAIVRFMGDVGKGFTPSGFGNRFEKQVRDGASRTSKGKTEKIRKLARFLSLEPNHVGVAKTLRALHELSSNDSDFGEVRIDYRNEFWDAVNVGEFDDPDEALIEIAHRRAYSRPRPHDKSISTIHKAKGLECDSVVVMPCDAQNFPDDRESRCLLYVAMSRAKKHLMLVVPKDNPSPLFETSSL
jgi:DNA helicase-2/ATP-dependent DNA helicase PcrA